MVEDIQMIQSEMAALEAKRNALEAALAEKNREWRAEGLSQIEAIMDEREISREDLAVHFKLRSGATVAAPAVKRARPVWRDTDGNEYRGGKFPKWLSARLEETGMTLDEYRHVFLKQVN
jgi:DNA-binding protein H-NS